MRSASIVLLAVTLLGCDRSPAPDVCAARARAYQAALPDAFACEPGIDACSAARPLVVSLQHVDGSAEVQGLCSTASCAVAVNPARTATLDAALASYREAGCELGACPCPTATPASPTCGDGGRCVGLIWP